MADALEIGPKMLRLFGYDIVFSKNRAFFSMEKCASVSEKYCEKEIEADLLNNI